MPASSLHLQSLSFVLSGLLWRVPAKQRWLQICKIPQCWLQSIPSAWESHPLPSAHFRGMAAARLRSCRRELTLALCFLWKPPGDHDSLSLSLLSLSLFLFLSFSLSLSFTLCLSLPLPLPLSLKGTLSSSGHDMALWKRYHKKCIDVSHHHQKS